jgi:hypothetical protein
MCISLCLGCSSGGQGIVLPELTDNTSGQFLSGFSPEASFNSDPRFQGVINTATSLGREASGVNPPLFQYPQYSPAEFNRTLSGWFVDPRKELDPRTLTGTIDQDTDIFSLITYKVEYLPYGGLKYHWKCDVPEKFGDWQMHYLDLRSRTTKEESTAFPLLSG